MPTYTKPYGDFTNNVDVADATKVNAQINGTYNAINGGLDSTNVPTLGDVTTLITSAKGSAVAAINEIVGYPINSVTRQSVINGGFSVNQRVVSGTVTLTSGQYGHDRWKAGAGGCTYTFATANNVTTITITAGSLLQVIEGINLYSGNYTLSWSGTAQGRIGAGAYGASGATSSVTGGTNTSIEFNAGTLSNVQFNIGNVKLPFQPRSFAEELALCQRYARGYTSTAINFVIGQGFAALGTVAAIQIPFFQPMRVTPTLVATATDWQLQDGGAVYDLTVIALDSGTSSTNVVTLNCTVASGLTQFRPYRLFADGTANRLLILDAEL